MTKKFSLACKEITFELIFDSTISIAVTDSFTARRLFNGPLAVKCLKHPPNGQRTWQDQHSPELNEAKWINGAITKSLACKWRWHVTSWICNSRQKRSCAVVELHRSPQFSTFYSFYWATDTSHPKYALKCIFTLDHSHFVLQTQWFNQKAYCVAERITRDWQPSLKWKPWQEDRMSFQGK